MLKLTNTETGESKELTQASIGLILSGLVELADIPSREKPAHVLYDTIRDLAYPKHHNDSDDADDAISHIEEV